MKRTFKSSILTALLCLISLPSIYADVANSVGNGVGEVVTGVGKGVEDLGTGVGDAVKDVGTGVGNAFQGKKSTHTSDVDITNQIRDKIKNLKQNNKIANDDSLNVQTSKGIVNISGEVSNASDIEMVKNEASKIPGVQSITVNIEVSGK